jgi:hypothetical protein
LNSKVHVIAPHAVPLDSLSPMDTYAGRGKIEI